MESPSVYAALREKKFVLQHMLGEGSYAKVYRAVYIVDETRTVDLACKVIDTSTAPRAYLSKFLPRELDILARVNHPHIIHVTNIYQRYAKYFVFMRLGENGDLLNYISTKGPLSEAQCRVWMRQLMCALEYMHALNIAHRDLKCENILISANFNVKLTDFGFARRTRDGGPNDVMSDTFCGSLLYAAPEILKGVPYAPKMADLWSMGVILYAMLNKALPFNDTSVRILYDKQVQRKWRFRSKIVSMVSEECLALVTGMLEPDAQARPTATAVFNGPWIAMEPRLAKYTPIEESLLKQAMKDLEKPRNLEECDSETGTMKTLKKLDPKLIAPVNGSGPLAHGK
ncbi:testis-specific serine/threonine-protein kinase 1-like [Cydia pomonella]|uniref:testis-specific serine/threonine-protein kinase 1-like n=1 Tax=Cydia pomonella TaxID=82600 RepID=UPI002ADD893B|nr:testis-specific serine/threonine-protein kinase 1-like [Cydia pomonella]